MWGLKFCRMSRSSLVPFWSTYNFYSCYSVFLGEVRSGPSGRCFSVGLYLVKQSPFTFLFVSYWEGWVKESLSVKSTGLFSSNHLPQGCSKRLMEPGVKLHLGPPSWHLIFTALDHRLSVTFSCSAGNLPYKLM